MKTTKRDGKRVCVTIARGEDGSRIVRETFSSSAHDAMKYAIVCAIANGTMPSWGISQNEEV